MLYIVRARFNVARALFFKLANRCLYQKCDRSRRYFKEKYWTKASRRLLEYYARSKFGFFKYIFQNIELCHQYTKHTCIGKTVLYYKVQDPHAKYVREITRAYMYTPLCLYELKSIFKINIYNGYELQLM